MAQFSFCLFIVLLVSPYIEARVSNVFNNVINIKNDNVKGSISPSPSPSPIISQISQAPEGPAPFNSGIAPTPIDAVEGGLPPGPVEPVGGGGIAPAPVDGGGIVPTPVEGGSAPAPADLVEYDHAYGLYGRDGLNNQMLSRQTTYPTRTPTSNVDDLVDEDELPKDFETESFREFNSGESYNAYANRYNNNNNNNNNRNGYIGSSYYNNYNNGNAYVERQGMSDTRFMENGRYYYDMNNENYNQNGYRNDNNGGRYYGEKSNYEFDSMDEYERQQGYPDSQRELVP